jgi:LCP family protein required for cell wall assembly
MDDDGLQANAPRHAKAPKQRRWVKRTAIGVTVAVVAGGVLGGAGWFYVNYRENQLINEIHSIKPKNLVHVKPGAPENILLIGSDSRANIPPDEQVHYGGPGGSNAVTGQRSDVIIIMRIVPATKQVEMLSIPRDTFVHIPVANYDDRINASFNWGPSLLIKTIEDDFHIPINHFVYTTFIGFANGVSALHGIYLNFPDKVKDNVTGLNIRKTGCQLLSGPEALALVRSRDLSYYANGQWNYDGLGDLSRVRRQAAFFHAVINRIHQIWNPFDLNNFIGDIVPDITVDSGFKSQLVSLANEFHGIASQSLQTEVLPTRGAVIGGADVLLPVPSYDNLMIKSFLRLGTPKASTGGSAGGGSASTTPTTSPAPPTTVYVTGTTTPIIFDTSKNYPEPWNPTPC